jgi:hypothetical protein
MSTFRNALVFFDQLGVYDVVLPFLLIFTLVFAMLEKTKVFGEEHTADGHHKTRKNLNAMVAFCCSFLVVASAQLVAVINHTIAKVMVLLVMSVLFMVLVSSFSKDEALYLKGGWHSAFTWIMFLGIILILLYNLGWMQFIWGYAATNLNGPVVGSFGLLIVMLAFMFWISKDSSHGAGHASNEKSGGGGGGH